MSATIRDADTCHEWHRGGPVKPLDIRIYRHGGAWCYALRIDGEFDHSDELDCPDDATEAEAIACATQMSLVIDGPRTVTVAAS